MSEDETAEVFKFSGGLNQLKGEIILNRLVSSQHLGAVIVKHLLAFFPAVLSVCLRQRPHKGVNLRTTLVVVIYQRVDRKTFRQIVFRFNPPLVFYKVLQFVAEINL